MSVYSFMLLNKLEDMKVKTATPYFSQGLMQKSYKVPAFKGLTFLFFCLSKGYRLCPLIT